MRYSTQQDVLDFVEDNNVKFVRFAFCDIFGTQKNIAVLASDLPKALEDGVCFDGSSIAGFMKVEESDLVLRPDLPTVTILPWRPTEGRVMQFFCDVEKPDDAPFGGNCRGFLREMNRRFRSWALPATSVPSASSICSRTTTGAVPPASPSTLAATSTWPRWTRARTCAATSA